MKNAARVVIFISIGFLTMVSFCYGQIFNSTRKSPYNKVFEATDNFGASYLSILEDAFKKVQNDSVRFSILNDLAYYWHTRNLTTALNFTKKGLALSAEKKDTVWEGRFQITAGAILLRMEKLDSAYLVLEAAKHKVPEKDLAFLNTQIGYVFERRGQLDRAADYAQESLKLGEKLHDKKAIALAYSDLSNLFWKQSKFEKGLEYGLRSVKIFEERGINDLDYDFTLYLVGNNYLALKKHDEAKSFYELAIVIGERYGFYNNLSDIYISLVDLYAYLNEFKKADEAGVKAVKYAGLLDNNFMLMRSWLSIGEMQNLEGKYITAIESLKKCIAVATNKFGDKYYLSRAYNALGKAYAGNHNYQDAYTAFAEYDKFKNEVFTAEADERISLLQTEFDVAQKESTIEIQQNSLKQQKTRQVYIIIIALLLLVFSGLLIKLLRNNRKKNKLLEQQNKEKEFLLKEIHHRVKNNLEIVSSLLALQSAQIKDSNVVEAMQDIQNRVYSMSMIHQRLYKGKNLASIEMKDYFINLGNYILDSFSADDRISLEYAMDTLELDIDTAVPLGLIVNELLTNAFKHAFPNKREGTIRIALKNTGSHTLELVIADNGVGKKQHENDSNSGFGMQLIKLLTQQINGKIKWEYEQGTSVNFIFKTEKAA